ncbi:MAG: flavin reductase family protein [Alphaproteobacteria bacterium]|nr:MAG: flavin reductase family protein [Alphaproteobacteria bacterium]
MFYRTDGGRPEALRHNPFKAIVAPRPIGWIATRDRDGRNNLAPYSFFNAIADDPPMVMFATTGPKPDGSPKDSLTNIRETGVFCVNIVSEAQIEAMNASSAHLPAGEDEFARAGLQALPCETIDCARVAGAPASLECRLWRIIELPGAANAVTIGEVTGIHIDDRHLRDGILDVTRYRPLARLGYRDYTLVRELFALDRPDD